jgi:4-hydroxythreonine-4-phosphate dehydrogenase
VPRHRDSVRSSDAADPAKALALSQGDPAGIGLDIAISAWSQRKKYALPAFALYGDPEALRARARALGSSLSVAEIDGPAEAAMAFSKGIPVIPVPLATPATAGRPDPGNAPAVIGAIVAATASVVRGEADALVTLPIAKSVLTGADFAYPGHTEFLAELANRHYPGARHTPVMMLVAEEVRVVPLTIHVPLKSVPSLITAERILETARIMHKALIEWFGIGSPRIVVAGLNPHAGEDGTIGKEEQEVIAPAVARLRAEGLDVRGPLSADTLFHTAARKRYDAALAMYHDQALIPVKTLAFDRGVNVTLGLPFVRTSPDHGTAFDIAGTGRASPTSLIAAMKLAAQMAGRRARLPP